MTPGPGFKVKRVSSSISQIIESDFKYGLIIYK